MIRNDYTVWDFMSYNLFKESTQSAIEEARGRVNISQLRVRTAQMMSRS